MTVAIALALLVQVADAQLIHPPAELHKAQPSDFDFAEAWDGPCFGTRSRPAPDHAFAQACKQWSEPQYFHGVWEVGFEMSNFTFMGRMDCYKMGDRSCIDLRGESLPWPDADDCNREFELKFIGRRSLHAVSGHLGTPTFAVIVDRVIDAKRLPDPYNWLCPGNPDEAGK